MNVYPTPYLVYWPDLGETSDDRVQIDDCESAESATSVAAERLHKRDPDRSWPMTAEVYSPEFKRSWTVYVNLDWRPVFRACAVSR